MGQFTMVLLGAVPALQFFFLSPQMKIRLLALNQLAKMYQRSFAKFMVSFLPLKLAVNYCGSSKVNNPFNLFFVLCDSSVAIDRL